MRTAIVTIGLLVGAAFSICTLVEPWFQQWAGNRTRSANALAIALGDGRKLFARHIFAKADAYFHRGYYASIFDSQPKSGGLAHQTAGHDCEGEAAKPLDWLEAFGRKFYASEHTHIGESHASSGCNHAGCNHDHGEEAHAEHAGEDTNNAALGEFFAHEGKSSGEEKELLPWLKLASTLDPEQPDTYVVASFWLRTKLGKVDEAEKFLREGLNHNPSNPSLLFELGRIFSENRNDPRRARNLWELALAECERNKTEDVLLHAQVLINLAKLDYEAKRYDTAMNYINKLMTVSPNRAGLETWIRDLREAAAKSPRP